MDRKGIYIYGFIPNYYLTDIKTILIDSGIYSIEYGSIAALVSDTMVDDIEYLNREDLAYLLVDHQKKIELIMSTGCSTIIPMQLGTIVNSGNDVIKIVKNGLHIINKTFDDIADIQEFDLVVMWNNFPDLIKKISDTPQIRIMKEEIANKGSYDQADSINIGKIIKKKIDEKNSKVNLDIMNSLSSLCICVKKHESMNDEMPLNSAFLIKKDKENSFIEMVNQLDIKYENLLRYKIVGPLPCYSFYTLESKLLNKKEIEKAEKILGIEAYKSESDIKKAYRAKAAHAHPDKNNTISAIDNDDFIEINKAYQILLEYSSVFKDFPDHKPDEPFYLVKIKK